MKLRIVHRPSRGRHRDLRLARARTQIVPTLGRSRYYGKVTAESNKWKSKLISSSVPLEFEVAKILVASGFSVSGDFPYHRLDSGVDKEFSVDIRATRYIEAPEIVGGICAFEMLVECKQRQGEIAWLFLPDPNPRYSLLNSDVVHGVAEFTRWFIQDPLWEIDDVPVCYKGLEVDTSTGAAHDEQIRHGVAQLQYALPALIASRISVPMFSHGVRENAPFFVAAILVTSARLVVVDGSFDRKAVTSASCVLQLGAEVPYLALAAPSGPDFSRHTSRQFQGLTDLAQRKGVKAAEEHRRASGVHEWDLPSSLLRRIQMDGRELGAVVPLETVIVCNVHSLTSLLQQANAIAERSISSIQPDPLRWPLSRQDGA